LRDAFLPNLPAWTQARRGIARQYLEQIHNPGIAFAAPGSVDDSVWHLFPVLVQRREEFQQHLRGHAITTSIHYPRLIPDQTALNEIRGTDSRVELNNARRFAREEVSLPIHPFMTKDEVEAVIAACNSWSRP
jgi:dTDP-4-amino-4,6-dideoxygalactose transaminase